MSTSALLVVLDNSSNLCLKNTHPPITVVHTFKKTALAFNVPTHMINCTYSFFFLFLLSINCTYSVFTLLGKFEQIKQCELLEQTSQNLHIEEANQEFSIHFIIAFSQVLADIYLFLLRHLSSTLNAFYMMTFVGVKFGSLTLFCSFGILSRSQKKEKTKQEMTIQTKS